jgi:hypothetical protein
VALFFDFFDFAVKNLCVLTHCLNSDEILVGADEEYNIESTSLLLETIRGNGGNLNIFSHTYDEAKEALDSCLNWIESPSFDPQKANRTTLYFRQEGYKRSDVELIIASFDRKLRENNIIIRSTPEYTVQNTCIDENDFQKIFEDEMYKSSPWFQKEAYQKRTLSDIASICAIARLRNGKKYISSLRDAKYLFVTSNGNLVNSNHLYDKRHNRNRNVDVPECVSDVFIGTYLWVNTPQIAEKTNALKLKAIALSAIRPNAEMEKALYLEAKKLLSSNKITGDDI